MRRLVIATLLFAFASGTASAGDLPAEIMDQPDAPIKVLGCSATPRPMQNGTNVTERASFESIGPRTATAVRIGFAFFDVLGGRHVRSGLASGTYTPGARIDLKPYAGVIGAETRRLVCFAAQASFSDGTTWTTNVLPAASSAATTAPPATAAPVPAASAAPTPP